ncbi:MAG TPA: hypothetical protein VEJ20_01285 [Candidatus Eremiobacteraceae bacterium]|nr:hypothetical protein [Candidatus Eremiobacteraceae bacterium]
MTQFKRFLIGRIGGFARATILKLNAIPNPPAPDSATGRRRPTFTHKLFLS